jgi:hypothetical protein
MAGLGQAIESDHFTMLPDHRSATVQIAYGDITQLGPNLSRGAKIAIIAGVAAAVIIVIVFTIKVVSSG